MIPVPVSIDTHILNHQSFENHETLFLTFHLGVRGQIHLRARSTFSADDRRRDREDAFGRLNANNNIFRYWAAIAAAQYVEDNYHQVMMCRRQLNIFEESNVARSQFEIGLILDALVNLVKGNQYRNGQGFDSQWNDSARDIHGLDGASQPRSRQIYNAHNELFHQVCRDVHNAKETDDDTFQLLVDTGRYECLDFINTGLVNLTEREVAAEIFIREVFLVRSGLFEKVSQHDFVFVTHFHSWNTPNTCILGLYWCS